jgi:hypothetical protein
MRPTSLFNALFCSWHMYIKQKSLSCPESGTDVMILKIFLPKKIAKKLAKIAENCDHNIDPWFAMSSIFRKYFFKNNCVANAFIFLNTQTHNSIYVFKKKTYTLAGIEPGSSDDLEMFWRQKIPFCGRAAWS